MSRIEGYLSVRLTEQETGELRDALQNGRHFKVVVGKMPIVDLSIAFEIDHQVVYDYDDDKGILTIRKKPR